MSDPGAATTDLTDPAEAARIAIYSLPIATILTLVAANFMLKSRGVHWQDLGLRKPGSIFKTILYGLGIFIVTAVIGGLVNIGMESLGYTQDLSLFDVLQDDFVMYLYLATVISWFSAALVTANPAAFFPFTKVSISLPKTSNIFNETNPPLEANEIVNLIIVFGLNGLG